MVPSGLEGLRAVVGWAFEERIALIPRGGGTGMPGGNVGPYLTVEVGPGFQDIEWVDEGRGRLRAGAGVVAADAERFAREAGFTLPFLPSSRRLCRIGGMVANNAAGARSFRHGATAASVTGVEGLFAWGDPFRVGAGATEPDVFWELRSRLERTLAATVPDGRMLPDWPRVRKNASGYALDRYLPQGDPAQLLAGSEGTLALITHVELHLVPEPEARGLIVLAARSLSDLERIAELAAELGTETCEFLGRRFLHISGIAGGAGPGPARADPRVRSLAEAAEALVLIEVAGSTEEVDAGISAVRTEGGPRALGSLVARDPDEIERLWELRHSASPMIAQEAVRGRFSMQFIEDSVVPPGALGSYLSGLDRILESAGLDAVTFGHAGDGNVHVNPLVDVYDPDWRERVRKALNGVTELVASLGGTLSGEHGDGRLRAPLLERIWGPRMMDAFRLVKEMLDPRGILNPGVILPLGGQDPLEGLRPKPPEGLPGREGGAHLSAFDSPTSLPDGVA